MYKNFNLTDKEREQILESHSSHGYKKPMNETPKTNTFVNEQSKVDPKRSAFFDGLAKQISSKIVGKTFLFGKIGVLDNTTIVVQKYMDRNHAVNLKDYPVKEFNLFFSVRRVQEDLYKNEKPGTRVWTGAIQISGTFNNGKLSPRPIVELWPMFNNKIEFSGPAMTPSKPWTWDMVGGSDIWSTAAKINQQQAVFSENEDLNEQNPLMGLIRGFTSPAVKILRRGALMSDVIASPAVKSLITKYGTVVMSDFVKGALRPFEDNMVIFINDYKKLQSFKVPGVSQYDNVAFLNQQIDSIKRGLVPAGKDKGIGLDYLYISTYRLSTYIDNIIAAKQVKPQGVALLKGMKQTANRALESLEDAIGQIATKK